MTERLKKIGILGGTFDPIHFGHLFLAQTALDACGLDKVLIMPSPNPYYRTDKVVTDQTHRVNMINLAIADNPGLELSEFELTLPQPNYTAMTLEAFKIANPDAELFFILGGDSLFSIETWYEPQKLFDSVTILSSKREDEAKGASGSCEASDNYLDFNNDGINDREQVETLEDEFELQAEFLRRKYNANIINIHVPNIEISSSGIIRRIKAGQSVKYYLPDAVIDYIESNGLYRPE